MKQNFIFLSIALLSSFGVVHAQTLDDSSVIKSVWMVKQHSCNSFVAHESSRSPNAAEIARTRVVQIPKLDLVFRIPGIPELPVSSVRLVFDDRGRKVIDHYVLLSRNDLDSPVAAVMVTELPPEFDTPQKALGAAIASERDNLRGTSAQPAVDRITTVWGEGLDVFVPHRIGSPCFPAARYQLTAAPQEKPTIGLSRFITLPGRLIQLAIVVNMLPGTSMEEQKANARRIMDAFAAGLLKL